MNHALYILSVGLFLAMPPVLIAIHIGYSKYFPWLLVVVLVMGGGWVLVNSSVYFYFRYLDDVIRSTPQPSQKLLDQWSNDGAKRVFAFVFGWLYGLVYLCPWVAAYGLFRGIRTMVRRARCVS